MPTNLWQMYMNRVDVAADLGITAQLTGITLRRPQVLSIHAASDRATRMAIATGDAVNLHIIHATQSAEGYEPCFGRADAPCAQSKCTYYQSCMALVDFDPDASLPISAVMPASRRMPADTLVHPDFDRPQRLVPAAGYGLDALENAEAN